ncbi:CoA transferase [Aeromicrobium sp. YIM 150415]|uniref:CoA transferase n=1 Tax=Aeromicrobium piscarium TaxID=2590901 RepID=A0A554S798_9ACTN|nr:MULTISPECIES: CoA transferase [Aeromicrobium]MBM9463350.1 CoA transferase [Aeromicrobium sp. YIM 150415]TSD62212.1 CoA transferase [Aeromicrobium piscarium]
MTEGAPLSAGEGPLRGVRVLDASTMLAGPLTGGLLADFGAEVIKVEDTRGGDPMRLISSDEDGRSVLSKISHRNKRSVAIDLRDAQGQALFRELTGQVDVVVTNLRMSTLERWGLGYPELSRANPGLIMYHLSAFGRSGTRRDDPGFARVAEAYSGLTYASGDPDGPPMFSGYAIADGVGGVHGAFAVLLALYEARVSGRGQLVEVSLAGAMVRMLEGLVAAYETTGRSPERSGNRNDSIAPNGIYRTADDQWIVLPISTPSMWQRLWVALGRPEVAEDERFRTNADRLRHREELEAVLEPMIAGRELDDLYESLRAHQVAVGRVNSMADLFADADAWEEGLLVRVPDEGGRDVVMPGVVPHLSGTPGGIRHPGPASGQHTDEVLRELLDLGDGALGTLRAEGVIA